MKKKAAKRTTKAAGEVEALRKALKYMRESADVSHARFNEAQSEVVMLRKALAAESQAHADERGKLRAEIASLRRMLDAGTYLKGGIVAGFERDPYGGPTSRWVKEYGG